MHVDWTADLNDQIRRDYITRDGFEALMSRIGATPDTTVVFYGDKNNWWATYAFWVFQLFGHTKAKIMDGGRLKWEKEGRELTPRRRRPSRRRSYKAPERNDKTHPRLPRRGRSRSSRRRASWSTCAAPTSTAASACTCPTTRTRARCAAATSRARRACRGRKAVNPEDGTFKSVDELKKLYIEEQGLDPPSRSSAYCRIGERSSHTWFALTYLLGFPNVRNYDGSWTEWGNSVGLPIEK